MRTKVLLLMVLFLVAGLAASACEFKFGVDGDVKKCKPGDELVVTVELKLTHRACSVAAAQTKFKAEGLQVVGATEWKQENPTTFTRKVKVKVVDDGKKVVKLTATRSCDKEGGLGVFTLPKE